MSCFSIRKQSITADEALIHIFTAFLWLLLIKSLNTFPFSAFEISQTW